LVAPPASWRIRAHGSLPKPRADPGEFGERVAERHRVHWQSQDLATSPQWSRFGDLIRLISRIRGYGDFVHYHLLARGALDAVIESDVNILDIAALTVIVRAAGGVFTDLEGREVGLETTSVLAQQCDDACEGV